MRWTILGLALIILWSFGMVALPEVNVTWDEALGDLFFGQRYLSYFTSFDPIYLDVHADPYPAGHQPDLRLSPFRGRPWEYYPFANTVAAATSVVFSDLLGWLDAFDGFHAVNLLFASLLLVVMFRFTEVRLGMVAAVASLGLLFGSPRIVAHMLANIKDFPLMTLYALTAFAFFRAFEAGSVRGILASGVLLGLTLGTKANALFFPLMVVLLLIGAGVPETWRQRRGTLAATLISAGTLAVVVMVAVWPYLWIDPIEHFGRHLRYILTRKDAIASEFEAPVLSAIALTTPPIFLGAFVLGLGVTLRRAFRRERLAIFLLAWMASSLARYLLPQSTNFDGVRHFLEFFPAMALVAGWGVAWLLHHATARLENRAVVNASKAVALLLVLLPGAWSVLRTHPFQLAYWNSLAGGYAGARAADLPQAGDYWGTSYRQGLRWLNQHAEPGALVAVPVVEHAVRLVAPERLRDDLTLLPITTPYSPRIAPERLQKMLRSAETTPLYVMFVERRDWMNPLMLDCLRRLQPAVVWSLEEQPILRVYRYLPPPGAAATRAPGDARSPSG